MRVAYPTQWSDFNFQQWQDYFCSPAITILGMTQPHKMGTK